MQPTRRDLGALMAFGLVQMLYSRELFADEVKPTLDVWFKDLVAMTKDLRGRKLTDLEFQKKMEELYAKVPLKDLVQLVKLDEIEKKRKLPASGADSTSFDITKLPGLPATLGFGKQIFGCAKGRSIVPHGHVNMCTGFIVLKGKWHGRHYDRLETLADHYVIKPTIDKEFGPGDLSTISDHKDNIHWFRAVSDVGYIFNVHVQGYDPNEKEASGRQYVDPDGEKLAGGRIKAPMMSSTDCHKKYG